jgi:aldehyde:ferredoxin oxidoreductase
LTSPLTKRLVPGGGSLEICFKSPLTGTWGEARVGGEFGFALQEAGYDFVIIEGKAEKPCYIAVENGKVEIKSAEHLLGNTSTEKISKIEEELGQNYSILTIGQAGENQVLYSSIMFNHRAAGRGGAGAVMGSKNLLAFAIKGNKDVEIADKEKFMAAVKNAHKKIRKNAGPEGWSEGGTTAGLESCDKAGDLPTKNWNSNYWGKGAKLYEYFKKNNLVDSKPCYKGCPLSCGRIAEVKEGKYKTPRHEGAEYESMAAFTAFILNENIDVAVYCDYLCNEYGLDTISTGAAIAFAMECYENNILSEEQIDNLDLTWGNEEILPVLVKKIANREGLGDLLASGVKRAAEKLGRGSEQFAVQVKGLEAPAHDPRSGKALAVSYGTGTRGSCHIHPVEAFNYDNNKRTFQLLDYGLLDPEKIDRWDEKGKGAPIKLLQDGCTLPDIMGTCKFMFYVGIGVTEYSEMLAGLTGWDIDGWDLLEIGERTINLQKLFNIREGFKREGDMIHPRMAERPKFGIYHDQEECIIKDYSAMLDEYYEARNWNKETSEPNFDKLKELGLEGYIKK